MPWTYLSIMLQHEHVVLAAVRNPKPSYHVIESRLATILWDFWQPVMEGYSDPQIEKLRI